MVPPPVLIVLLMVDYNQDVKKVKSYFDKKRLHRCRLYDTLIVEKFFGGAGFDRSEGDAVC